MDFVVGLALNLPAFRAALLAGLSTACLVVGDCDQTVVL